MTGERNVERRADVLVLGGSIVGTSAALHLRKLGLSVILLERDRVGQRASGVNFGGVRQQGRALRELPLSRRARKLWADLPSLIGILAQVENSFHAHDALARFRQQFAKPVT